MQVFATTVVGLLVAAVLIQRYLKYLRNKEELQKVRSHNQLLQHKH